MSTYNCDQCKEPIKRSVQSKAKHHFCSRQCNDKYHHDYKNKTPLVFVCSVCGITFTRKCIGKESKHHVCSYKCLGLALSPRIQLMCAYCKKPFEVRLGEYNGKVESGVIKENMTCSDKCRWAYQSILQRDEFSSFRQMFLAAKTVSERKVRRNKPCTMTLEDLRDQWIKQDGKCAYSGLQMMLPETSRGWDKRHSPLCASLDRINSDEGYSKENIQFVCMPLNFAKNSFTDVVFRRFLEDLVKSYIQNKINYSPSPDSIPKKEGTQDESPLSTTLALQPAPQT